MMYESMFVYVCVCVYLCVHACLFMYVSTLVSVYRWVVTFNVMHGRGNHVYATIIIDSETFTIYSLPLATTTAPMSSHKGEWTHPIHTHTRVRARMHAPTHTSKLVACFSSKHFKWYDQLCSLLGIKQLLNY